jgi:hypothetical protein
VAEVAGAAAVALVVVLAALVCWLRTCRSEESA